MAKQGKIITCKHCGKEIAKSAKHCPHCGGKNKKPIYKRIWFWVLILLVIGVVAGSGSSTDSAKKVSGSGEDTGDNMTAVSGSEAAGAAEDAPMPELESTVIYEGNDVVITATGIEKQGRGYGINLLIENNSALNLGFNAHAYGINGIMTRNNIYAMDCDVAAGKKANTTLELEGSVLEEYGISTVRCVDVLFWAYDNDESFISFDTDQIEIQTSLYDGSHDKINGTTIYDQDGIKADFLGVSEAGDEYLFCLTNTTGAYLDFDCNEITFNDFTNSETDYDLFDEVLLNNSQIVITIRLDDEFKAANQIETVSALQWNMELRPRGDYFESKNIGPIVCTFE